MPAKGKTRYSIGDMKKIAEERGGQCLSKRYENPKDKLEWKCHVEEHPLFKMNWNNVQQNKWCRLCGIKSAADAKRSNIEKMQKLAEARGGKCLSTEYINSYSKLRWKCGYDPHPVFLMEPQAFNMGQWCPSCSTGRGEKICRAYFEQLFGISFPSKRPDFLVNSTGFNLELDGYNEESRLAFEHQGGMHYKQIDHFHDNEADFELRRAYDQLKVERCKEVSIRLFVIPEIPKLTKIKDLKKVIREECLRLEVQIPEGFDKLEIDLSKAYSLDSEHDRRNLENLQKIAHERGGKLLSEVYLGSSEKLEWICSQKHQWLADSNHVRRGSWCPECGGSKKKTLEDMQNLALRKEGKCLSDVYIDARTNLSWECKEGHFWQATPTSVQSGTWCLECAGLSKWTIDELQALAKLKGGQLQSTEYKNVKTPLLWKCEVGAHKPWEAPASTIQQGKWCPLCGGTKKLTIEDMKQMALEKEGKFLSQEYINGETLHEWKCKNNHLFSMRPDGVRQGKWCQECAGNAKGTLEEIQAIAFERGGKCLSTKYINVDSKLKFECKEKHKFSLVPYYLKKGQWCRDCKEKEKFKKLEEIAKSNGGQLLTKKFLGVTKKHSWQCRNGHQWDAEPSNVKRGTWCPICSRQKKD